MKILLISVVIACSCTAWAQYDDGPVPPRLSFSGGIPVAQQRPNGFRQARIQSAPPPQGSIRLRRPGSVRGPAFKSVDISARPVLQSLEDPQKPVIEDSEEENSSGSSPSPLFGSSNSPFNPIRPQITLQELDDDDFPSFLSNTSPSPRPISLPNFFNSQPLIPEKLDIEIKPQQNSKPTNPNTIPQTQNFKPSTPNNFQPQQQILRTEPPRQELVRLEQQRPQPARIQPLSYRPSRPQYRPEPQQDSSSEEDNEPAQPVRQFNRAPEHSPRPQVRIPPTPAPQKYKPSNREKKPVSQTLRKYREENEDGSITWGYENDDGSYKEETIGNDCVTRGKYGYVDPDGLKREYTYETGIPCDKSQIQEESEKGFIDYHENKAVLPNGVVIDLAAMGKKKSRRPLRAAQTTQNKN